MQAALDPSLSVRLVIRESGRLQEGIQTDAAAKGRPKSARWNLKERQGKCSTGGGKNPGFRVEEDGSGTGRNEGLAQMCSWQFNETPFLFSSLLPSYDKALAAASRCHPRGLSQICTA